MTSSLAFRHLFLGLSVAALFACQPTTPPSTSAAVPQTTPAEKAEEPLTAETQTPAPQSAGAHPLFATILPELDRQTDVPVRLPGVVPEVTADNPVYAIIEGVSASEYQILLGFTPDCNGGTACRLGQVSAAASPLTPPEGGEAVTLSQGIQGYFVPATCGANCSDALVMWEQNGNQYTIGLKGGQKERLLEMANSSLMAPQ